ncbi:MAG: hypothetical protein RLZZ232_2295, partial [Planctomycetota bacterium]
MRICSNSLAALCLLLGLTAPGLADQVEYNRDIRPILAEHCFSCHGPDSASRKADLRLDQRDAALQGGAIVPGAPDASEIIRRIHVDDPETVMPPPEVKKPLSAIQKQRLAEWIQGGAQYQAHWSLLPPEKAPVPEVPADLQQRWAHWQSNPIDRFVLQQLLAAGLEPANEADRRVLARRAALDIT